MTTPPAPREVNALERTTGHLSRWFTGHGATACAHLASVLLLSSTVLQAVQSPDWIWILVAVLGVVSAITAGVFALFVKPGYNQLRREHQELDDECARLRNSQAAMLGYLAKRALIDIVEEDEKTLMTSRISIYVEQQGQFVLLGRWAKNEKFRRVGRRSFPIDQGLIGQAWKSKDGVAKVRKLPADEDRWVDQQCNRYGFDEETARNLTMQSRSISAVRIDSGPKSGVFVIESELPDAFSIFEMHDLKEHRLLVDINHAISDNGVVNPMLGTEVAEVPGLRS